MDSEPDEFTFLPSENGWAFNAISGAEESARNGEVVEAERLFTEGIALYREGGSGLDFAFGRFGNFLLSQGRTDEAVVALAEALAMGTDIPAIWGDYISILAERHEIAAMFSTFDRLPMRLAEGSSVTEWILPYAGRALRAGDAEYAEELCRSVCDQARQRGDAPGAFKAIGQHGLILEKLGRTDEAISEWQNSFDAGSDDPTTVDKLSLALDRAKRFEEAEAVIRAALVRGYRANTEETLKKRLVRIEGKSRPGTRKTDVPVFSARAGEGFANLVMQRRLSPPIRRIAIMGTTAYCLGFKGGDGILTRVDVETGEAATKTGFPQFTDLRVLPSGWGIGLSWVGRLGKGRSSIYFLDPEGEITTTIDLPDILSEVAHGSGQWYLGCRNGSLFAYDIEGRFCWEWVMPGSKPVPENPYARIYPYHVAATEAFVATSTWGDIYAIGRDGRQLWKREVPKQGPLTRTMHFGDSLPHGEAWQVLGVVPGTTDEEVTHAYRKMVMATHPDHHPDEPDAAARFRRVQSAYEEILATDHTERTQREISIEYTNYEFVRSISAAADRILVASSDGVLAMLDAAGETTGRRVLGHEWVISALDGSGTVVAAWCGGTLSFFDGESIINSVEMDSFPNTLLPWGDEVLCTGNGGLRVFDRAGRTLWNVDFSKAVSGTSINDRYLVCGAGALVVFERSGKARLGSASVGGAG
jgi:tetratricopeptide (TPR) repeat protein/outer membrane protein assembly factor BamB